MAFNMSAKGVQVIEWYLTLNAGCPTEINLQAPADPKNPTSDSDLLFDMNGGLKTECRTRMASDYPGPAG